MADGTVPRPVDPPPICLAIGLFKFAFVGGLNTVITYVVYLVLLEIGLHYNLALTIDYSLLTVNRFRRATERGLAPREAIVDAAANSAPTIALAGC